MAALSIPAPGEFSAYMRLMRHSLSLHDFSVYRRLDDLTTSFFSITASRNYLGSRFSLYCCYRCMFHAFTALLGLKLHTQKELYDVSLLFNIVLAKCIILNDRPM